MIQGFLFLDIRPATYDLTINDIRPCYIRMSLDFLRFFLDIVPC